MLETEVMSIIIEIVKVLVLYLFNLLNFYRSDITAESLSSDTRTIMEEISRCLNLEKMLQCYKYTVTVESLKALRKLQKFGHLPNHVELFKDYASYGQFHGIRCIPFDYIPI